MKTALIHSIYKPYTRGGAEAMVDNIAFGLKSRQEDFFVITLGYENKIEDVDGVKVYRIKSSNLFNYLNIFGQPIWKRFFWHIIDMFNFVQALGIYKILKQEKPDLALTHSLKGLGYLTLSAINFLKIKNIHTVHDMQLISPTGLLPKKSLSFFERIYLQICKILFGSPKAVIFPSEFIKKIYTDFGFFGKAELLVVSNPIKNIDNLKMDSNTSNNLRLTFVGQVEEYKGIFDLIKALKSIQNGWSLKVVGEGGALEKAKELAKDMSKIEFLGKIGQDELKKKVWLNTDLLINPSQVPESFGMTILEANSFGLPALVSRVGAFPELVKENETGWFFEPQNILDLQEKLNFILTNPEKLNNMRLACLEQAKKSSIENYLNKILAI